MTLPTLIQAIPGPVGRLQVGLSVPDAASRCAMIIGHPHPLFGGTMDNKVVTTLARAAYGAGHPVVRFNFRGVGDSEGVFDHGRGECDDLLAVMTWVEQQHPVDAWVLSGFSFGSYIAYQMAQRRRCDGLICVAPPVHHFDFTTPVPTGPAWVIQGDADEVVPFTEVVTWIEKCGWSSKFTVMPGVSHFFHGHLLPLRDEVKRILHQFSSQ